MSLSVSDPSVIVALLFAASLVSWFVWRVCDIFDVYAARLLRRVLRRAKPTSPVLLFGIMSVLLAALTGRTWAAPIAGYETGLVVNYGPSFSPRSLDYVYIDSVNGSYYTDGSPDEVLTLLDGNDVPGGPTHLVGLVDVGNSFLWLFDVQGGTIQGKALFSYSGALQNIGADIADVQGSLEGQSFAGLSVASVPEPASGGVFALLTCIGLVQRRRGKPTVSM